MKKYTFSALAVSMLLFSYSCKDKDKAVLPESYDNYSQLKTGNYWIYNIYDVDSLGNGMATDKYDSAYISGDTVIRGNTYYIKIDHYPGYRSELLRDSLHYLVNEQGTISFSSRDFQSLFYPDHLISGGDTIARKTQKMTDRDAVFTVPAGTFATSDFQTIYDMYPDYRLAGTHRVIHKRHAKNIGVISETIPFWINNPQIEEKRLVRYHVN